MLADEDAWGLPEAFWDGLHPRRGGRRVAAGAVPAGARERLRDYLGSPARQRILGRWVDYDRELLAAGERHLADPGPDPVAAAVAALTVGDGELLADVWVDDGGVGFAVRAVAEAFRLVDAGALWTAPPQGNTALWREEDLRRACLVARVVRRHLAASSPEAYAEAAEILAAYRTGPGGRIGASYLMPTRVDWVDADCAAAASWDDRDLNGLLVLAASRAAHLELLRDAVTGTLLGPGALATVLDGVGPETAGFLEDPFYVRLFRLFDGVEPILAGIPGDGAFRMLLAGALERPGWLLGSGVLSRYPVRALRVLAERDDPVSRDLFGGLVLAEPRLIPQLSGVAPDGEGAGIGAAPHHAETTAASEGAARERAEAIVASGGAGIGAGWAALLDGGGLSGDDLKRVVGALAAIPSDEAFGLLVDRADRKHVRAALRAAAKRAPDRAARVLAGRADDPAAAELLLEHLRAFPAAAAAIDESGRAATAAAMGGIGRAPQPGAVSAVVGVLGAPLARPPAFPDWLVVSMLPPVTVRASGEALSRAEVRRLCQLLALSEIGAPRPEIAEVRAVCERRELSAFGWAIVEQWRDAGYPPKNGLALTALAALGDDTVVAKLTALFPKWTSAGPRDAGRHGCARRDRHRSRARSSAPIQP